MLVLTRRIGERLFIGDQEIIVTVLAVSGNKVRLGITAPPDVSIHREELWSRSHKEAMAAVECSFR